MKIGPTEVAVGLGIAILMFGRIKKEVDSFKSYQNGAKDETTGADNSKNNGSVSGMQ